MSAISKRAINESFHSHVMPSQASLFFVDLKVSFFISFIFCFCRSQSNLFFRCREKNELTRNSLGWIFMKDFFGFAPPSPTRFNDFSWKERFRCPHPLELEHEWNISFFGLFARSYHCHRLRFSGFKYLANYVGCANKFHIKIDFVPNYAVPLSYEDMLMFVV